MAQRRTTTTTRRRNKGSEKLLPTAEHIDAYIAAINFIFTIDVKQEVNRVDAIDVLHKWVHGDLAAPGEKIVPKHLSFAAIDCFECCKDLNGLPYFICLAKCIWTGQCPNH